MVYGLGRVGGALALGLKAARWDVRVHTRSPAKARRMKLALAEDLSQADVVVLAVPDAMVGAIEVPDGPAVVHCAGALELSALNAQRRGSFHPLVAVSSPNDSLEGGWVAVSASDARLENTLKRMAKALKMNVLTVPENQRARYHAGAVMSAGLVIALLDAAVEATGLPRAKAEKALIALTRSALQGAAARGLAKSMTGPIVRGDAAVVERHLAALPPDLASLYRALSKRALKLKGEDASLAALLGD
ncbi:MAG: DUF2520 domain-containing protein [Archangiaceae bacterium]|nr:DUF2520 domain-containing protein [Archangiaceae bacterium]